MEESVLRQKPKVLLEIVYVCALNELDVDDDVRQFVINNLDNIFLILLPGLISIFV